MKILLLGGQGFIGRNLIEVLAKQHTCTAVDLGSANGDSRRTGMLGIDPYTARLTSQADVVIHLIDHRLPLPAFRAAEERLISNLAPTGAARWLVFSSAVLYSNPQSEYAQRKQALEQLYNSYCRRQGYRLSILRVFNTYGRFQRPNTPGSLIANLFHNYLSDRPSVINDLDARRDFIYATDIGLLVQHLIDSGWTGTTDVGTGATRSIGELIALLEKDVLRDRLIYTVDPRPETGPMPAAQPTLPWPMRPRSLLAGLHQTFTYYKDNWEIIKR